MTTGIDESLNRLQTDWVDIWHLHKEDLVTPLAETVATMGDIITQDKVLWGSSTIGLSNGEIVRLCERMGVPNPWSASYIKTQ